ncbi:hypothetical protein Desor_1348 [Desulfosporosinus orientis DSM 765]|uniref:Uncharacterized protein n=1 Tax=Desulfosporosinus orientis (strain ATCC 19365 / DSM 765 / NCIMB 8382 / VKM B-1628 / Singapore I) TaxID=768706 RepID=G7W5S2_DESOD|nr:hypothetical protein [Desulfosporosinus orientis]AET67010.1 hypothetical protein Desor_1348 [Desulfosporosinus orientis DSM 765]
MSYEINGAIVKEQDLTFAVVAVKPHIFENDKEIQKARNAYRHVFPGIPIILMSQDSQGRATYSGKKNIVQFLATVDPRRIPWRRFIIS